MQKTSLIASLMLATLLQTISLKANLQGELIHLTDTLTDLEMALNIRPQPQPEPRRQVTPAPSTTTACPVTPPGKTLRRVQSAYLPKQPLSQSAETPTAKPKPAPQPRATLAQTTPPGGIPVAKKIEPEESPIEKIQRLAKERQERRKSLGAPLKPLSTPGEFQIPTLRRKQVSPKKESVLDIFQLVDRGEGLQKDFIVKKEIKLPKPLTTGIDLFISQQVNTLSTAEDKKITAAEINTFINTRVKDKDSTNNQLQIFKALATILTIDPLLIQTSIETLRIINVPNEDIYQLMAELYTGRVDYLSYEFELMQQNLTKNPNQALPKGTRDAIDEGLTYPIEISGEVQDAQIKAEKNNDRLAGNFFNNINIQWERLLLLLRGLSGQQKEALRKEGIDIDQYITNIEENKLRAYCRYDPKLRTKECQPYISFYQELNKMAQAANDFKENKSKYNRSTRTFAIQNIINKLNAFAIYAQDPKICQVCLNEDAQKANEENTNNNFADIETLFNDLLVQEPSNKKYSETLEVIESIKSDEANRRSKVRRGGVGYQYQ